MEPAGWYLGTGPVLVADYNLLNKAVVHLEGSYTLTTKVNDVPEMQPDPSYPNPHFLNLLVEIRPESRFYLGFEHVRSVNRGSIPNDGVRTDIHLGIKLFVDD
jgi:hypothetical protein